MKAISWKLSPYLSYLLCLLILCIICPLSSCNHPWIASMQGFYCSKRDGLTHLQNKVSFGMTHLEISAWLSGWRLWAYCGSRCLWLPRILGMLINFHISFKLPLWLEQSISERSPQVSFFLLNTLKRGYVWNFLVLFRHLSNALYICKATLKSAPRSRNFWRHLHTKDCDVTFRLCALQQTL